MILPDAILSVRHEVLTLCAEAGWLKAGSRIEDGIAASGVTWTEPQPEFMAWSVRMEKEIAGEIEDPFERCRYDGLEDRRWGDHEHCYCEDGRKVRAVKGESRIDGFADAPGTMGGKTHGYMGLR